MLVCCVFELLKRVSDWIFALLHEKAAVEHIRHKKSFTFERCFSIMPLVNRGVVPIGRTAVSKTDGCGFESCHPCQIKQRLAQKWASRFYLCRKRCRKRLSQNCMFILVFATDSSNDSYLSVACVHFDQRFVVARALPSPSAVNCLPPDLLIT